MGNLGCLRGSGCSCGVCLSSLLSNDKLRNRVYAWSKLNTGRLSWRTYLGWRVRKIETIRYKILIITELSPSNELGQVKVFRETRRSKIPFLMTNILLKGWVRIPMNTSDNRWTHLDLKIASVWAMWKKCLRSGSLRVLTGGLWFDLTQSPCSGNLGVVSIFQHHVHLEKEVVEDGFDEKEGLPANLPFSSSFRPVLPTMVPIIEDFLLDRSRQLLSPC